jgi:predicted O-methyltransferase YrrM
MKEESQLELLENFERNFKREYDGFRENKSAEVQGFFLNNKGFLRVDAEILYSFVRYFKPKRIVEIGSGFSTYVTAQAVEMNKGEDVGYECDFTAIEPYPRNFMKRGIPGLSRLVESKIQDVPWMEFTKLQKGDILFIDSTHVLKIGSDVQYEYLEIIPRLNPGVIIHVHDIFLPQDYPREWVMYKHWFFTEQYLLQAFLAFNGSFEVLWASNYMRINHPEALKKAFRSYEAVSLPPSSLWMKRTK